MDTLQSALADLVTDLDKAKSVLMFLAADSPQLIAGYHDQLLSHFGTNRDVDTVLAKTVAETAKFAETRSPLGEAGVISKLVELLTSAAEKAAFDKEACTQCFRALGNLCFDHVENRDRVLACGGAESIAAAFELVMANADLDREDPALLHCAAAGVVLNLAMDHKDAQDKCSSLNVPAMLAKQYCQALGNPIELNMTLRAMGEFATERESEMANIITENPTAVRNLVSAVHSVALAARGAAQEKQENGGDVINDDEDGDEEEEDKNADVELGILRVILKDDNRLSAFATRELVDMLLEATNSKDIKLAGATAMLVGTLMGDDTCQAFIISDGLDSSLDRFLEWTGASKTHPNEWDLTAAGAMAIGNIARNDEKSKLLVDKEKVLQTLIELVNSEKSGFQYAALGTIKNLAIPKDNKSRLIQTQGMAPALMLALNSPQAFIQYVASSIVRSLCISQSPDDVNVISNCEGLFDRLAHLGQQETEAVRYEATRAVASIIRYGKHVSDSMKPCIPACVSMASAESPLLVIEALVTLTRMAGQPDFRSKIAELNGLEVATKATEHKSASPEIICNALSLIGVLHENAEYSQETKQMLLRYADSSNSQIANHAKSILGNKNTI